MNKVELTTTVYDLTQALQRQREVNERLLAALSLIMAGVDYMERESIDHNLAPHVLEAARAAIAAAGATP